MTSCSNYLYRTHTSSKIQLARPKQTKITTGEIKDRLHNNEVFISLPLVCCSNKNESKLIQTLDEIPINPNTKIVSLDISNKYTVRGTE